MNKTKLKAEIKKGKFSKSEERVLNFIMEHKSITSLDGSRDLGIIHLPARIRCLKEKGVEIISEFIEVKNRFNEVCRVKVYSIK